MLSTLVVIGYFIISHVGMMIVFRFSSYFRLFWKVLPILILYGCLVVWGLHILHFEEYFIPFLVLEFIWLIAGWWRKNKAIKAMLGKVRGDEIMEGVLQNSIKQNVQPYFWSAVTYLLSITATNVVLT